MTELSESTKALQGAFADWDATYGADVTVYDEGLCLASVCTRLDDDKTDAAMAARPTGSTRGWQRCADPTFAGGEPNPCPCDAEPQARRHVLYEAWTVAAPEHNLGRLREQMQICLARASALREAAEGLARDQPEDPAGYVRSIADANDSASDLLIELITERQPAVQA